MSANPPAVNRSLWRALLLPWTWLMAWRDSRTQRRRLLIFSISIVAGISALVAIYGLKASVQAGINSQAKALLGSDLHISSRQPIPDAELAKIAPLVEQTSRETGFSSMLYFASADAARLVQIRGLEGGYPFYGKVETNPPEAWETMKRSGGILLEAALLEQFHSKVGDRVKLGSSELTIVGSVKMGAPRSSRFSGFAPEAYVRLSDLPATGLLATNSLAFYHLHLALKDAADSALDGSKKKSPAQIIRKRLAEQGRQFETPENRRDALGKTLERFQQFLGLIALVALVLGAIGVAGAIHSHVSRRVPSIAILRCLGCPGNQAFGIYLAQALVLGSGGALVGAFLGSALHFGVITFFRDNLPLAIHPIPSWSVVFGTTAAGFAVCCGFALLPLLRIRNISPGITLRQADALSPGSRGARWAIYLLLALLLTGFSWMSGNTPLRSLALSASLGAAFLLLAGAAKLLMFLTRRLLSPGWPYLLRQGISNIYRPQNQTLLFILSLGLGTFLLLLTLLSKNLLVERVSVSRNQNGPNLYLVDVQPDQLEGVQSLLKSQGLPVLETSPMVTMRIKSVKGVPVEKLKVRKVGANKEEGTPKWVLDREFRTTYRDRLNETETVVSGKWEPKIEPNAPVPLSLEKEIASDLHVVVGDEMVLDVQGVLISAKVTSLREVDWSRFNLNFFMVFPPGVLESAPGFNVVTTRVPSQTASGALQRSLVEKFPTISAIDLTVILETVNSILDRISRIVEILAGFTVLAGLPILIGTLLNGRDARLRESVLLRTIGASSRQIRTILLVEYVTLGSLSALVAIGLASAANYALAVWVFDASPWPNPGLLLQTFAASTGLVVLTGWALGRSSLK